MTHDVERCVHLVPEIQVGDTSRASVFCITVPILFGSFHIIVKVCNRNDAMHTNYVHQIYNCVYLWGRMNMSSVLRRNIISFHSW